MSFRKITIIIIILFFNTLNYQLTYDSAILPPFYLLSIFINDTLRGFLLWVLVVKTFKYIKNSSFKSDIQQSFYKVLAPFTVSFLGAVLWLFLAYLLIPFVWLSPLSFGTHLSIITVMLFFVVGSYFLWDTYYPNYKPSCTVIHIQKGAEFIHIPLSQVLWFEVEEGLVYVTNIYHERFFTDQSFREIQQLIDRNYYKVNSNFIVHHGVIEEPFEEEGNLNLYINISETKKKIITVSKLKKNSFKN